MAEWPSLDELKQVLDVTSTDWDGVGYDGDETRLSGALAAAIDQVKDDRGNWDEYEDVPDAKLYKAALRMAELIATRPDGRAGFHLTADPTYQRLMKGRRRRFAIA